MTPDGSDRTIPHTAARVASGELSAVTLLEEHLQRVNQENPGLNAIVTLTAETARQKALLLDQRVAGGGEVGPLAGVIFTVKDLIATAGVRSTGGSALLEDYVPNWGSTAVERLLRADAIMLGKTNCPEFGLSIHTDNEIFGLTRNPLNPDLSPGGSSGGDAAAVASGMSDFGIGTDYGGSIRVPAHCTGLVSIRPTCGIVPGTGQLPGAYSDSPRSPNSSSFQARLQTIAPIVRSTQDLFPILKVMAGPDSIDNNTVSFHLKPVRTRPYANIHVAWCRGDGRYPVGNEVLAVITATARSLSEAGLSIEEQTPDGLNCAEDVYSALRSFEGYREIEELARGREDRLSQHTRDLLHNSAGAGSFRECLSIVAEADDIRVRFNRFLNKWPILLMPVAAIPAFPVSATQFNVDGHDLDGFQIESCCRAITLLGVPSVVIPCGSTGDGRPVGLQVIGRRFHDAEVISVATVVEEVMNRVGPNPLTGQGL